MYELGQTYKFEIKNDVFYTGEVLEEDSTMIRIHTKYKETVVLSKNAIVQSIKTDRTGEINDSRKDSRRNLRINE